MPDGSTASNGDVAPDQSPVDVAGFFMLDTSKPLTFSATGSVSNSSSTPTAPPDGDTSFFPFGIRHSGGDENGISDMRAPINSLVGVFLDANQPDLFAAPGALDFGSNGNVPGGTDYLSLSPELRQVFFIGDSVTSGGAGQHVMAPAGATRLFLGTMDGTGWFNNTGAFTAQVTTASDITIVDVTYTDLASPTGPVSLGLDEVPESVPARFIFDGTPFGRTTFGLDDVLFAELSIGDGTWTKDDLVSFSLDYIEQDNLFQVTDLTYEFGPITTPTAVMDVILNNPFSLTVSGTDIASGQEFGWVHQNSVQMFTIIPEPSALMLALTAVGLLCSASNRRVSGK